MLRRIGQEPPGTKGDTVAYPADISHGVPVGIIIGGKRPGRADVIVPEKIVGPLLRVDYKAVVMNQKDEIGPDVRRKLIDHEVIELVDAVNLLTVPVMNVRRQPQRLPIGDEDGIAKVDSPHGVFHGLDGFIDFHATHGDQRDIRKLKLPVAVFHSYASLVFYEDFSSDAFHVGMIPARRRAERSILRRKKSPYRPLRRSTCPACRSFPGRTFRRA